MRGRVLRRAGRLVAVGTLAAGLIGSAESAATADTDPTPPATTPVSTAPPAPSTDPAPPATTSGSTPAAPVTSPAPTPPATTPPATTPPAPTTPAPTPVTSLTSAVKKQVEQSLADLGYPTGTVDGTVTSLTKQGLCAWRYTHGLSGGRSGLTVDLAVSILAGPASPVVSRSDGIYVDKTCQVLFQVVNHKYKRIVRVSTAGPGYNTPNGTGYVWKKISGWHESSLYPGAYMYDPLYFRTDRPAIALHGSASNSLVHTYPASHGCVRVWRPTIAKIFAETPIGTPVHVFGAY